MAKTDPQQTLFRRLRLREIERIIDARFDGPVPDEVDDRDLDYGGLYVQLAADHAPPHREVSSWLTEWVATWAPTWTGRYVEAAAKVSGGKGRRYTADRIARLLKVSFEERERLHLKTVGACDMTVKQRKKKVAGKKKHRDRVGAERRRRAKRAMPRAEYEANSLARTRPWEEQGISERTFYRQKAAATACGPQRAA